MEFWISRLFSRASMDHQPCISSWRSRSNAKVKQDVPICRSSFARFVPSVGVYKLTGNFSLIEHHPSRQIQIFLSRFTSQTKFSTSIISPSSETWKEVLVHITVRTGKRGLVRDLSSQLAQPALNALYEAIPFIA